MARTGSRGDPHETPALAVEIECAHLAEPQPISLFCVSSTLGLKDVPDFATDPKERLDVTLNQYTASLQSETTLPLPDRPRSACGRNRTRFRQRQTWPRLRSVGTWHWASVSR